MAVREIFQAYGPSYLETFADSVPIQHRKAIRDIINCRTPELGAIVCRCEGCGKTYPIYRSCGNRHCPTCQADKAYLWLDHRLDELLPVPHFMITFTVPAAFRDFFRSHQRFSYSAFFQAISRIMIKLASENTYFPGDIPGFFAVLHTWGRQLQYHPHIHTIVPGGAFDSQDYSWKPSNQSFYLPVRIMSKLVKQRFYTAMKKKKLLHLIPPGAWKKDWNVNSQPVGNGARSVRYLASYVFRTAISDHRIVQVKGDQVCFRYTDTKTAKSKTMKLKAFEFIRRFLQHVLPRGFMKVRYYGFMHPSSHFPLKVAAVLMGASCGFYGRKKKEGDPAIPRCSECNSIVRYLYFIPPEDLLSSGFT
jgi:hypothetical protein